VGEVRIGRVLLSTSQHVAAKMFATNTAADGAGLAAQQIGVDLAVFIYDCGDETGRRQAGVVCNPIVKLPERVTLNAFSRRRAAVTTGRRPSVCTTSTLDRAASGAAPPRMSIQK
jgi:hypothetical protein